MKLLYKYTMRIFWGPFFFGVGIFAVLVFLADLFDHLKYFINTSASFIEIIKYFLFVIPFWTLVILPVAGLLASLFAISDMISHGEWTAALASGYTKRQIYMPIVVCICIIAGVNVVLQETVSPFLHKTADIIFRTKIKGKLYWNEMEKKNIVVKISRNSFLSGKILDIKNKTIERAILYEYEKGKINLQTDAKKALWDEKIGTWVFYDGVTRVFSKKSGIKEKKFTKWISALDIEPQNLVIEKVWPEDLTIRDIFKRVKALKKTGLPIGREITYLHVKFAAPFVNIIMCLLGIPFAMSLKKGGKMLHFAIAIMTAFFFWWIVSVFQSAGEAGMMNPVIAGWMPAVIFSFIVWFGLKKAER